MANRATGSWGSRSFEVTEPVIDRAMQILRVKEITETLPGVGVFVRDEAGG